MPIYTDFNAQYFTALNAGNGITVAASDVVVSAPVDIRGTDQGNLNNCNSSVKITGNATGKWQGKRTTFYNRYLLSDLKILLGGTVAVAAVKNISDFLTVFNLRYGTLLSMDDVEDAGFNVDPATGVGTVTLTAKKTSLSWLDSVTFNVVKGDASLAQLITQSTLNGLNYPNGQMGHESVTGVFSQSYMYPLDFTDFYSTFSTYQASATPWDANSAVGKALVAALNTKMNVTTWALTSDATWGLLGAKLDFAGLNSNDLPTNSKYKFVLKVTPPATNTRLIGPLYFTFNQPEDPNAV